MTGLLSLAAVIASIVGHPVPVSCTPLNSGQPGFTLLGYTNFYADGEPANIELAPQMCAAWSGAVPVTDPASAQADVAAGGALLIATHEAEHFRYADLNEAVTECRALRDYGTVLNTVLGPLRRFDLAGASLRALLRQGETGMNAAMPTQYHGGVC